MARGQRVQRYKCKACLRTFTARTFSKNYRLRKQRLTPMIIKLCCEGVSFRGIARTLEINVKTVESYFLREANIARDEQLKDIANGEIKTSFAQVDEVQTFEHSHKRPLGIQLAVRAKTSEIIVAKVCRIPMAAQTASRADKEAYQKMSTRNQAKVELALDLNKIMRDSKTIKSDGKYFCREIVEKIVDNVNYISEVHRNNPIWRLDKVVLMMRQHVSRLRRSTLATTKRIDRLQNHLDLYIRYHNDLKRRRRPAN